MVDPSTVHLEENSSVISSPVLSSSNSSSVTVSSPLPPTFSPVVSGISSHIYSTSSTDDCQSQSNVHTPKISTYKLVGDNIDKTVRPRHMRSDNQVRSLHYFHLYGVRDRIDLSDFEDKPSCLSAEDIDVTTVLPTTKDEATLKGLFGIHVARVLKKHMPFFSTFGKHLERHIEHEYTSEMSQKSEVVSTCLIMKT